MIVIDEKFLVIKEINGYLVDMILINSFRSGFRSGLGIRFHLRSYPICSHFPELKMAFVVVEVVAGGMAFILCGY
jgi:hypothetical protein